MRTLLVGAVVATVAFSGFAYAAGSGTPVKWNGYYLDAHGDCRDFQFDRIMEKRWCEGTPLHCTGDTKPCFVDGTWDHRCVAPNKVGPRNKVCLK